MRDELRKLSVCLCLLVGCTGGQTGVPARTGDRPHCDEQASDAGTRASDASADTSADAAADASTDSLTPGEIRAEAQLAQYLGTHTMHAYWVDAPLPPQSPTPFADPQDATPIELKLQIARGEGPALPKQACFDIRTIPVLVDLATDDGTVALSGVEGSFQEQLGWSAGMIRLMKPARGDIFLSDKVYALSLGIDGRAGALHAPDPCGAEQLPLSDPRWAGYPKRFIDLAARLLPRMQLQFLDNKPFHLRFELEPIRTSACANTNNSFAGSTLVQLRVTVVEREQTVVLSPASLKWSPCQDEAECANFGFSGRVRAQTDIDWPQGTAQVRLTEFAISAWGHLRPTGSEGEVTISTMWGPRNEADDSIAKFKLAP